MPIATIPQNGREASVALSAGNNGLNLNLAYASRTKTVFSLALQTKFSRGLSNIYDLGLGQVFKNNKHLIVATFGYGRHRVDHFTLGSTGSKLTSFADAFRASVYLNSAIYKDVFLVVRPSVYWGDAANTTIGYRPSAREAFITYALEPALFFRFGAKKKMFWGMGGFLPADGLKYFGYDYSDFVPAPVWVSLGYRFGRSF